MSFGHLDRETPRMGKRKTILRLAFSLKTYVALWISTEEVPNGSVCIGSLNDGLAIAILSGNLKNPLVKGGRAFFHLGRIAPKPLNSEQCFKL